jgi:hypothetical protein
MRGSSKVHACTLSTHWPMPLPSPSTRHVLSLISFVQKLENNTNYNTHLRAECPFCYPSPPSSSPSLPLLPLLPSCRRCRRRRRCRCRHRRCCRCHRRHRLCPFSSLIHFHNPNVSSYPIIRPVPHITLTHWFPTSSPPLPRFVRHRRRLCRWLHCRLLLSCGYWRC